MRYIPKWLREINWWELRPTKEITYGAITALMIAILGSWLLPSYIAKINDRNHFIDNFAQIGQTRIYMAERFYRNVSEGETAISISNSWNDYIDSVKAWNSVNISNPIFIQYYFDQETRDEFTSALLPAMITLHNHLLELQKFGTTSANIPTEIEITKNHLFIFSENMLGISYNF